MNLVKIIGWIMVGIGGMGFLLSFAMFGDIAIAAMIGSMGTLLSGFCFTRIAKYSKR